MRLKLFHYPEDNRFGVAVKLRPRRVVEHRVRSLITEPLAEISLAKRPDTLRSDELMLGYDLDARAYRQFYVGSMRGIQESEQLVLRIGIYDPLEDDEPMLYGRLFTDGRKDLADARQVLREAREWLRNHNKPFIAELFPLVNHQQLRAA